MGLEWSRVPGTDDWQLVDAATEQVVRLVTVRHPRAGEFGDTTFVVTGDAHDDSVHTSVAEGKAAAEESLAPWESALIARRRHEPSSSTGYPRGIGCRND